MVTSDHDPLIFFYSCRNLMDALGYYNQSKAYIMLDEFEKSMGEAIAAIYWRGTSMYFLAYRNLFLNSKNQRDLSIWAVRRKHSHRLLLPGILPQVILCRFVILESV